LSNFPQILLYNPDRFYAIMPCKHRSAAAWSSIFRIVIAIIKKDDGENNHDATQIHEMERGRPLKKNFERVKMKLKDLIKANRSRRRFDPRIAVEAATLRELVDLARLSASGANLQPLKYYLSCQSGTNSAIFSNLSWAGYLKDWEGPSEDERPTAYIVILGDGRIKKSFGADPGIAAQSILLGAAEKGLGGCIVGSIKRDALQKALCLPDHFEILLVIALGKPAETVVVEDVGPDGDIRYWRDENEVHHVPKRSLDDLIVGGPSSP
jgi:nitroreductase